MEQAGSSPTWYSLAARLGEGRAPEQVRYRSLGWIKEAVVHPEGHLLGGAGSVVAGGVLCSDFCVVWVLEELQANRLNATTKVKYTNLISVNFCV